MRLTATARRQSPTPVTATWQVRGNSGPGDTNHRVTNMWPSRHVTHRGLARSSGHASSRNSMTLASPPGRPVFAHRRRADLECRHVYRSCRLRYVGSSSPDSRRRCEYVNLQAARPGIVDARVGLFGGGRAPESPVCARRGHAEDALKVCHGCTEWRHGVAAGWHQVSVRPQMTTCGISSQVRRAPGVNDSRQDRPGNQDC